jgi:hypothetical protein
VGVVVANAVAVGQPGDVLNNIDITVSPAGRTWAAARTGYQSSAVGLPAGYASSRRRRVERRRHALDGVPLDGGLIFPFPIYRTLSRGYNHEIQTAAEIDLWRQPVA